MNHLNHSNHLPDLQAALPRYMMALEEVGGDDLSIGASALQGWQGGPPVGWPLYFKPVERQAVSLPEKQRRWRVLAEIAEAVADDFILFPDDDTRSYVSWDGKSVAATEKVIIASLAAHLRDVIRKKARAASRSMVDFLDIGDYRDLTFEVATAVVAARLRKKN